MEYDLTQGSVLKNLIRFSLPYLLSCFLQTFYGLADLFIAGQFNGADTITAVSVGSQVTHMLTVIIVGLAMGSTVFISRAVGCKDKNKVLKGIGNTVILFSVFAVVLALIFILLTEHILCWISTPEEAWQEAENYLLICFIGIPFITAYNMISSIFRGLGDSRSPMFFVGIAGIINVGLDYFLIGPLGMGAAGAALATVTAQACSVFLALAALFRTKSRFRLGRVHFCISKEILSSILKVGIPIAAQDGLIQISFLVITVIANRRGIEVAAAVGIVEKVISFLFLVPSAMLSTVSAIAAQNAGAGLHERGRKALRYGIILTVGTGAVFALVCQIRAEWILGLFAGEEPVVIRMGGEYLSAYAYDCAFAGIHFCFSGYFCAYQKSVISFGHNLASILLVRIPGAYLASVYFPDSLYPMGLAAPLGSLLSALICVVLFYILKKNYLEGQEKK